MSDGNAAPMRIDVVSDAICPWCYIGKRHLEGALAILADEGLKFDVAWHAFQLNPEMPEGGVERSEYRIAKFGSAEKARALDARITEAAASVGLTFRTDLMRRTPNTVNAHRLIRFAGEAGVQDAVVEGLFDAYFCRGADIGDAAVLAEAGAAAGLAGVEAFLASDAARAEVLAEDAMVRRAGINGVPSFIMGRHVLFSGAMPAEAMADAFRQAHAILSRQAA